MINGLYNKISKGEEIPGHDLGLQSQFILLKSKSEPLTFDRTQIVRYADLVEWDHLNLLGIAQG